ncbi:hypothetical protein [Gimesia aquarii]|uniref:Uncharacterized protein n=1 Tax=Gimesia aquarii TaxID=2527964 RepID=A0A517WN64_9PLAN|nr:hypothetical protein [Gimesia aquarii]QDU06678.1 hypothetical protein V202x_00210 [Gimesia aquarii]
MVVRFFTFLVIVIISFIHCEWASAADNYSFPASYYLPGDAFFHTVITEKTLKKLEENPDYAFEYNRSHWNYTFPGYYSLSLGKQNRKLAKQIKKAYEEVRYSMRLLRLKVRGKSPNSISGKSSEEKTEFVEINGPDLFFYNEDYDWKKMQFAIKYNEHWHQELMKFGYPNGDYAPFVKTPEAIIQSWRFSTVVPPLSVQLPDVPIIKHRAVDAPMIAKGRLRAIMLPDNKYKRYYKRKNYLHLIEITNEGYFTYHASEGEWRQSGVKLDNK